MNRSVWNVRSQTINATSRLWRKGIVFIGAVLVWCVLTALLLILLAVAGHAQNIDLKSVPGTTIGDRLSAAESAYCNSGTVCSIVIPAEMSTFATGTIPTTPANVWILDYRSPSLGLRYIPTGSSTLTSLGSTFTGGAITSPILAADGACSASNITYSMTDTGFYRDPTYGWIFCGVGFVDGSAFAGGYFRVKSAYVLQWTTTTTAKNSTIELELSKPNVGLLGIGQVNAVVAAKIGGKTNCDGIGALIGVFCYDLTLGKWRFSEANSALANAFGTANTPNYGANCNGVATASATLGLPGFGEITTVGCSGVYAGTQEHVMTSAGTATKLYVKCGTGGTNASSGVFTVMKNNAAQTITATIGTATSINDTAHSFSWVAGDSTGIRWTTQVGETLANCSASFE